MRKLAVVAVAGFAIALSGCSQTAKAPQSPTFTPTSTAPSTAAPDTKLIQAINPCALVTAMDLSEITGKQYFPMGETSTVDQSTHEQSCHYGVPEPTLRITTLLDTKKDGGVWHGFVKNHSITHRVNDIGDEAFRGDNVLLATRSGRMILSFERATPNAQNPSDDQLAALARRAVDRFASSS